MGSATRCESLKTLRYTGEYFGSLYRPADVKPFVRQLKKLQDVFGYVNDVATAGQLERISEEHCREVGRAARCRLRGGLARG